LVKLKNILVDQNTRPHQKLTNCLNNMSEDRDGLGEKFRPGKFITPGHISMFTLYGIGVTI